MAIALTHLGASIASGEGFAKGALEGTKAMQQMSKDQRETMQALRLAQLRGASETEIAELSRQADIVGTQIGAIPRPVTPAAQSEIQKLLEDMRRLKSAGQEDSSEYRSLQSRVETLITPKNITMSSVQAEVIGPILQEIAAGKPRSELSKSSQDLLDLWEKTSAADRLFRQVAAE